MTPEAERYLAKARLTLDRARLMLTVHLTEDAGRSAYLAGYQAAEAFIFERTGKVTKTHKGAHTEFLRAYRSMNRASTSKYDGFFRRLTILRRFEITSWVPTPSYHSIKRRLRFGLRRGLSILSQACLKRARRKRRGRDRPQKF